MSIRNKIFARLDTLDIINSPPAVIKEIIAIVNTDDSSPAALVDLIGRDSGLTAKILRVAGSSFQNISGSPREIDSAVVILGPTIAKYTVLFMALCDHLAARDSGREQVNIQLWRHSLETAAIAKNVADNLTCGREEDAYAAGLLHDLGRLLLPGHFGAESFRVQRLVKEGKTLVDAERAVLDTDHQEIGELICRRWNLPEFLAEAVGNHHPEDLDQISELSPLTRALVLADTLSQSGTEWPENPKSAAVRAGLIGRCAGSLELSPAEIGRLCLAVPREVLRNAEGMGVLMGEGMEYLFRANSEALRMYFELAGVYAERQGFTEAAPARQASAATLDSMRQALGSLSHFINNASMNISGQCEVLQILHDRGDVEQIFLKVPSMTQSIKASIKKISLALEGFPQPSSLKNVNSLDYSRAESGERATDGRIKVK